MPVVEHTTSLGPINAIVWSLYVSSPYSIKDDRAEMVWVHPLRGALGQVIFYIVWSGMNLHIHSADVHRFTFISGLYYTW